MEIFPIFHTTKSVDITVFEFEKKKTYTVLNPLTSKNIHHFESGG